jgi:hypothetical protein
LSCSASSCLIGVRCVSKRCALRVVGAVRQAQDACVPRSVAPRNEKRGTRPGSAAPATNEDWRRDMDSRTFDAMAKSLSNSVSRRRAIQGVLGGVVLAAVPSSLVPRQADAGSKAKKRCRSQGRVYLPKGTCHCADGSCVVPCHDNPDCHCYQTTEGRGFCAGIGHTTECTSTAQCQGEEACVETCIGLVCVPPCPS